MTQFRLSTVTWKWLVSALVLLSATLLVIEFTHSIKPLLIDGEQGSLGVTLADQIGANNLGQGTYRLRIDNLTPESPLLAAGARPGDRLKFDIDENRWRKFAPGEVVGLTLYQPAAERHLSVEARPVRITFAEYFDYWGRFLLALPALLFGLMIGFKQAEGQAYRSLSMTFIVLSLIYYYTFNYSPAGLSYTVSKLLNIATYSLIWYWCVAFALHYQAYGQGALRVWLRRCFPWYRALAFGTAAYSVGFAFGKETPMLWLGTLLGVVSGLVLVVLSLVDGWRNCTGEVRQRHLWLLLSFACGSVPAMLTLVPALDWTIEGLRVTVMFYFIGQFMMYLGLAYAVLQYRVFNFDFAISRAVVFSVVSVLLLCSFGLIEWIYASIMHGGAAAGHGAQKKSLVVDAAIALSAYLVFHKVHGTLERWVERFFFEKWHDNEHKLRRYVRHAAHITTVDALLGSLRTAIDRFTGQAGCAVYLKQASGDYTLVAGTLESAPAMVDTNDGLAVAMRTDMAPLFFDRLHTALPGELALPMCHRGTLNGFVLLGSKHRGHSYRPDECEVLGFTAHQIGLDLHALRVEALERELRELERKAKQQSDELQLMAGRRKSARQLVSG